MLQRLLAIRRADLAPPDEYLVRIFLVSRPAEQDGECSSMALVA